MPEDLGGFAENEFKGAERSLRWVAQLEPAVMTGRGPMKTPAALSAGSEMG